jgi:hypothetical protein
MLYKTHIISLSLHLAYKFYINSHTKYFFVINILKKLPILNFLSNKLTVFLEVTIKTTVLNIFVFYDIININIKQSP